MTLAGKTGSTSGIGLGIAQVLARAGANILLNGFGDPQPALDAIRGHGVKVGHHAADLADVAQIACRRGADRSAVRFRRA